MLGVKDCFGTVLRTCNVRRPARHTHKKNTHLHHVTDTRSRWELRLVVQVFYSPQLSNPTGCLPLQTCIQSIICRNACYIHRDRAGGRFLVLVSMLDIIAQPAGQSLKSGNAGQGMEDGGGRDWGDGWTGERPVWDSLGRAGGVRATCKHTSPTFQSSIHLGVFRRRAARPGRTGTVDGRPGSPHQPYPSPISNPDGAAT